MEAEALHIIQHSLGCDANGETTYRGRDEGDGCFEFYRNRYVSDPEPLLVAMVADGLLEDRGAVKMYGGMHYYRVTQRGVAEMKLRRKKLTPAQRRYREFLNADCGMSFGNWLKARPKHLFS